MTERLSVSPERVIPKVIVVAMNEELAQQYIDQGKAHPSTDAELVGTKYVGREESGEIDPNQVLITIPQPLNLGEFTELRNRMNEDLEEKKLSYLKQIIILIQLRFSANGE